MSSSSATVRVEKATSDLLIGPDWTLNIDICDSINSNHWQAKDVVKVLKKRLQHKNPKVQLLALTLLETMIKNCGDYVHFQIAERNILPEMIKIVRKKTDMQVRDKILALIDSWQEAFGGPGGKYSQYYWAYEELRRSGVEFPQRSRDAAPIFTPPLAHPMMRHSQAGYGMPSDTSRRLDEAMASEIEHLSLSNLDSMGSVMDLLADMLQAVNPNDYRAVKDEVIVDLVNQCRSNQKRLMQMLTSTGDEELLCQGLALNDSLQILLAKHDAIASGSPLPIELRSSSPVPTEVREASPSSSATQLASVTSTQLEEEEEEDDDFAQLARRRTKNTAVPLESASTGTGEGSQSVNQTGVITPTTAAASPLTSNPCNELALPTPPTAVKTTTTKEQDMIDLLSITLSTTSTSPHTPPSTSSHTAHQVPVSPTAQGHPYSQQPYTENHGHVPYNYVAPWAQPQPQVQPRQQPQPQVQLQPQPRSHLQAQPQTQPQPQPHSPLQAQPQPRPQQQFQFPQPSSNYPPPPWATAAPANFHQNLSSSTPPYNYSTAHATSSSSYMPVHGVRPLQSHNSFPLRGNNGSEMYGETQVNSPLRHGNPTVGQKPFIPSYRLFEDLNVLGNADGGVKTSSSGSSSTSGLSGMSGQSMVGGRK